MLYMEGAEVEAGAGLVGADLGFETRGAVVAGGLEPGVNMHVGMGQLVGELEGALGTMVAHGAAIEHQRR